LDPRTGRYLLDAEVMQGERAELTTPWPISIDAADLVLPHKRKR
jgi:hypothetical protein